MKSPCYDILVFYFNVCFISLLLESLKNSLCCSPVVTLGRETPTVYLAPFFSRWETPCLQSLCSGWSINIWCTVPWEAGVITQKAGKVEERGDLPKATQLKRGRAWFSPAAWVLSSSIGLSFSFSEVGIGLFLNCSSRIPEDSCVWKWIKGNLTKMEREGHKGALSHRTTRCQLQTPTGKDVHCVSYKTSTTLVTQPMRNGYLPELSLFFIGLSLKTILPNFFFFLHKITFPSFVGLAYGFCNSLLVPNFNSLLFSNKPIFAGKIAVWFLRSRVLALEIFGILGSNWGQKLPCVAWRPWGRGVALM